MAGEYQSEEMNRHRNRPKMDAGAAYYSNPAPPPPPPGTPVKGRDPAQTIPASKAYYANAKEGEPTDDSPVQVHTPRLDLDTTDFRDVEFSQWPGQLRRRVNKTKALLVMVHADQIQPFNDMVKQMEGMGHIPTGWASGTPTATSKSVEEGGFGRFKDKVHTAPLEKKKPAVTTVKPTPPPTDVKVDEREPSDEDLDNL